MYYISSPILIIESCQHLVNSLSFDDFFACFLYNKYRKAGYSMGKKGKTVAAILGGAAIGAGLGILFAPKSGKETRAELKA